MKLLFKFSTLLLAFALSVTQTFAENNARNPSTPKQTFNLKGWDYLYGLLIRNGLDPLFTRTTLSDRRMPHWDGLLFSLKPKESYSLYRKHRTERSVKSAYRCYLDHGTKFRLAEDEFRVPRSIVAALLQIETHCGKAVGRTRVLPRLARLASAAEPYNIAQSYRRRKSGNKHKFSDFEQRAHWLEHTFLPHLLAIFDLSVRLKIDPLELKGSSGGAIGVPQFLPGNVTLFGVDGDHDGKIDIFSHADAIPSVANFLSQNGWNELSPSLKNQRKAIAAYNRSEPYIDAALWLASKIATNIKRDEKNFVRLPISAPRR